MIGPSLGEAIGVVFRRARERRGLTYTAAGARMGISRMTVRRVERGERLNAGTVATMQAFYRLDTPDLLAAALDVSEGW